MIVVDSSVLIGLLKGKKNPAADRLAQLEADEIPFLVPAICFQEVLQGARDAREWRLLNEYLGSQRFLIPTDHVETHREAARIFFDCRRRGVTVRSTVDCLIAAQVIQSEGTLLHDDQDFERIKAVRRLVTLRD